MANLNKNEYRPRLSPREYSLIQDYRNGNNIGIIGDTHEPFCRKGYREFCQETFDKFGVGRVVHIGDEVDNHALSYHEHDPDGYSAGHEAERAQRNMELWYKAFPEAKVCVGNHSALPHRKGRTAGIPKRFLRAYNEVWSAPKGWEWALEWYLDDVKFTHGMGVSGMNGAYNLAMKSRQSTVIGHIHSFGGIQYHASQSDLIFGLNVGCGIDHEAYAFEYGRHFPNKPTIGCGIVFEGGNHGLFIPMPL